MYMLLHMWIYGSTERTRYHSIRATYDALASRETSEGFEIWGALYDETVRKVATPTQITACRLRDLKYLRCINERLHISSRLLAYIRPLGRPTQLSTDDDKQLFLYALAASRRQLCLGNNAEDYNTATLMSTLAHVRRVFQFCKISIRHLITRSFRNVMISPPPGMSAGTIELPEHCLHMVVSLVAATFNQRAEAGFATEIYYDKNLSM